MPSAGVSTHARDGVKAVIKNANLDGPTARSLRLVPTAPDVRTMLAIFDSVDAASAAVSAIIRNGVIPVALEMLDQAIIELVEPRIHAGYPLDAKRFYDQIQPAMARLGLTADQVWRKK